MSVENSTAQCQVKSRFFIHTIIGTCGCISECNHEHVAIGINGGWNYGAAVLYVCILYSACVL